MSTHTEHASDTKAEARKYLLTLVTLLILTAITVGASYIQFGAANVVIALTIATIKAIIVALIFMHLLHDKPVNAVIAVAGFVFLGIFLLFDFMDVAERAPILSPPTCMRHRPRPREPPREPQHRREPLAPRPPAATPAPDERKE